MKTTERKKLIKPPKRKKCKNCRKLFPLLEGRTRFYTVKFCSEDCRIEFNKEKYKELRKKTTKRNLEKSKHLKNKSGKMKVKCKFCKEYTEKYVSQIRHRGSAYCSMECRKSHTIVKKSIPQLKKLLWDVFSKYIRVRDAIKTTGTSEWVKCITCGKTKRTIEVDAGHFVSRTHTAIFFNEQNVHAQCKQCNMPPNSGEQYLYAKKLKELYGDSTPDKLMQRRGETKKYTKQELHELLSETKMKLQMFLDNYDSPWQT